MTKHKFQVWKTSVLIQGSLQIQLYLLREGLKNIFMDSVHLGGEGVWAE